MDRREALIEDIHPEPIEGLRMNVLFGTSILNIALGVDIDQGAHTREVEQPGCIRYL
jgi:hypothetical protein